MKITIHKFIYDTDNGTGCDLFLREKDAVAALVSCANSWGYEGPENEEAVQEWRDKRPFNNDTYFIDSEDIEVPYGPTFHEIAEAVEGLIHEVQLENSLRVDGELHGRIRDAVNKGRKALSHFHGLFNNHREDPKCYIIVGRQPEGQNSCWTGLAESEEAAFESFCQKLCDDDEITREHLDSLGGPIIEYSGWTTTPITHLYSE